MRFPGALACLMVFFFFLFCFAGVVAAVGLPTRRANVPPVQYCGRIQWSRRQRVCIIINWVRPSVVKLLLLYALVITFSPTLLRALQQP